MATGIYTVSTQRIPPGGLKQGWVFITAIVNNKPPVLPAMARLRCMMGQKNWVELFVGLLLGELLSGGITTKHYCPCKLTCSTKD